MSDYAEIVALVEGPTEKIFITEMIKPYLFSKDVFITPIIISKPGQKGGDVKFARVKNDIELHLKQRSNTYLTLFVDFYGIRGDWPGLDDAKQQSRPEKKAYKINKSTKEKVEELFREHDADRRFIPYVAMCVFRSIRHLVTILSGTSIRFYPALCNRSEATLFKNLQGAGWYPPKPSF